MHRRSEVKMRLRRICGIIFCRSFCDKVLCERVSRVSRSEVVALLNEPVQVGLVPDVEKGEVLVDSRGRGSFQKRCSEDG